MQNVTKEVPLKNTPFETAVSSSIIIGGKGRFVSNNYKINQVLTMCKAGVRMYMLLSPLSYLAFYCFIACKNFMGSSLEKIKKIKNKNLLLLDRERRSFELHKNL